METLVTMVLLSEAAREKLITLHDQELYPFMCKQVAVFLTDDANSN